MPVDKEDRPKYQEPMVFKGRITEQWYCDAEIVCSSKSQALKFSKAIKALVEAERKRKEPGK